MNNFKCRVCGSETFSTIHIHDSSINCCDGCSTIFKNPTLFGQELSKVDVVNKDEIIKMNKEFTDMKNDIIDINNKIGIVKSAVDKLNSNMTTLDKKISKS